MQDSNLPCFQLLLLLLAAPATAIRVVKSNGGGLQQHQLPSPVEYYPSDSLPVVSFLYLDLDYPCSALKKPDMKTLSGREYVFGRTKIFSLTVRSNCNADCFLSLPPN